MNNVHAKGTQILGGTIAQNFVAAVTLRPVTCSINSSGKQVKANQMFGAYGAYREENK